MHATSLWYARLLIGRWRYDDHGLVLNQHRAVRSRRTVRLHNIYVPLLLLNRHCGTPLVLKLNRSSVMSAHDCSCVSAINNTIFTVLFAGPLLTCFNIHTSGASIFGGMKSETKV